MGAQSIGQVGSYKHMQMRNTGTASINFSKWLKEPGSCGSGEGWGGSAWPGRAPAPASAPGRPAARCPAKVPADVPFKTLFLSPVSEERHKT